MRNFDWQGFAVVLLVVLVFGSLIIENMSKADRFAACEARSGIMRNIDGHMQCVAGGEHGR